MTTLTRREFLKLVFGSVSAAALTGPLALLWPEAEKARPQADPLELYLEEDNHLVDGPRRENLEWVPIPRREHLGLDRMTLDGAARNFAFPDRRQPPELYYHRCTALPRVKRRGITPSQRHRPVALGGRQLPRGHGSRDAILRMARMLQFLQAPQPLYRRDQHDSLVGPIVH